jgi:hypothetical protein
MRHRHRDGGIRHFGGWKAGFFAKIHGIRQKSRFFLKKFKNILTNQHVWSIIGNVILEGCDNMPDHTRIGGEMECIQNA